MYLEDYYTIDVREFLRDSKNWKSRIRHLKEQMPNVTELEKAQFESQIERLKNLERLKNSALRQVTAEELDCIEFMHGKVSDTAEEPLDIEELCEKYQIGSKSAAYDRVARGEKKILNYIMVSGFPLDEFYRFDVCKFLKDAENWEIHIANARAQIAYDQALASKGNMSTGNSVSYPKNPVEANVISNDSQYEIIRKYEFLLCVFREAAESLDTNRDCLQKELIYIMFLPKNRDKYKTKATRLLKVADLKKVSNSIAEKDLRKAKKGMKDFVEKKYFRSVYAHEYI